MNENNYLCSFDLGHGCFANVIDIVRSSDTISSMTEEKNKDDLLTDNLNLGESVEDLKEKLAKNNIKIKELGECIEGLGELIDKLSKGKS